MWFLQTIEAEVEVDAEGEPAIANVRQHDILDPQADADAEAHEELPDQTGPRWAQRGPQAFEDAAQEHTRRGLIPENVQAAMQDIEERMNRPFRVQPEPRPAQAIPFFLQDLAQHHPYTAIAALGFTAGLTVAGMGWAGLRMGRWLSHRTGHRHAFGQGGAPATIAHLENMERRVVQMLEGARVEQNVRLTQIAPELFRAARAAENARYEAMRGLPEQGVAARVDEQRRGLRERRDGAGTPPPPPPYVPDEPDAHGIVVPPGALQEMVARVEGLEAEVASLRQSVERQTDEIARLAEIIQRQASPLDSDNRAGDPPSPPPPSGRVSGSIPSANNVEMTGPVLAQTRPITNVPPEDVPMPTQNDTSGSTDTVDDPSARPEAAGPERTPNDPPNASEEEARKRSQEPAEPIFNMSEISAAVGQLQRKYISDTTTAQSDTESVESMDGDEVTSVDRTATASDRSETDSHSKDKGKGIAQPADCSVVSDAATESNAQPASDEGWSPIDMIEAVDASRREAAGVQGTSQLGAQDSEAGPSGWRGRRTAFSADSTGASLRDSPADRARFTGPSSRRSFRLLEEITEPVRNEWITMPIEMVIAKYDSKTHGSFGFGYTRSERRVRSFATYAELYISGDISLIKLDGTVWRCGLENGEYVIRERIGAE